MAIHVSNARDTVAFVGSGSETPIIMFYLGSASEMPASNPGNDEVLTPLQDLIKYV